MKFIGINYNIEIMDLLTILLISDFFILCLLVKYRRLRLRLEAVEKHLNIPAPK